MINQDVLKNAKKLQKAFESGTLYKHVCIDDFFDEPVAEQLLAEFPPFDAKKALNEFGKVGPKCVHTDIKAISPAYEKLHHYIRSQDFLQAISAITGIPELLPDPNLYGGGTHENVDGAELDPHVDFNYDPCTHYHRRLNVLFYLNHEWEESWGGAIELHSDPTEWRTGNDKVISYNCIFNRCVIFATSENSWHGFRKIKLPEDKKAQGISRKLISIYLYTKERPREEVAPSHGTFYLPYPPRTLDAQKQAGDVYLTKKSAKQAVAMSIADYEEMLRLVEKRDKLLKASFANEKRLSGTIEEHRNYLQELTAVIHPVTKGYVSPVRGKTSGYFHDRWVTKDFSMSVKNDTDIKQVSIRGWLPDNQAVELSVSINESAVEPKQFTSGVMEWDIPLHISAGSESVIRITSVRKQGAENNADGRGDLVFVLNAIEFRERAASEQGMYVIPAAAGIRNSKAS
jgi:Rps23 Pro-64 3,4-dihydroxylase Tpa1-like proline 4-hydroxylase